MNKITFAIVYLVCLFLYAHTGWDIPTQGARLLVIGTTIWALWTVFAWICRHYPIAGWALFGFLSGLLGGGRRRW